MDATIGQELARDAAAELREYANDHPVVTNREQAKAATLQIDHVKPPPARAATASVTDACHICGQTVSPGCEVCGAKKRAGNHG